MEDEQVQPVVESPYIQRYELTIVAEAEVTKAEDVGREEDEVQP